MTDRLTDLLDERARRAGVQASMEGVHRAIDRRARRRRRRRAVGGGVAGLVLVAGIAGGVALSSGDAGDPAPVVSTPPTDLPLVGVDLVGHRFDPTFEVPQTWPSRELTYAAFTSSEFDALGPMVTASADVATGEDDPGGSPVDLDGDGDPIGEADGRIVTYDNGATTVTWTSGDQGAQVTGHEVAADDVLAYVRQLTGLPFDLETMPAPDGLPQREVITFEPQPDFPSRLAVYRGDSVVHVLTTADPGYYDLTRVVSSEGKPYEEIPLGDTFLGSGVAILSPDDDGMTSALVRTDGGLIVHVFGPSLDADTLRDAVEFGHLVELEPAAPTVTTTTAPPAPTTTGR